MDISLSATLRDKTKPSQLRREGFLPGVIYGPDVPPKGITLSYKEFIRAFKKAGESQVIYLEVAGEKTSVLIQDIQRNLISERFIHVDFYRFKAGSKVHATIPLEFKGVSPAVKDKGGMLLTNIREIEVRSLPDKLVSSIPVDVSMLDEIGQEITLGDLLIPEGIEPLQDLQETVVSVVEPQRKEEEAPTEEVVQEEDAQGESEGEAKKE